MRKILMFLATLLSALAFAGRPLPEWLVGAYWLLISLYWFLQTYKR